MSKHNRTVNEASVFNLEKWNRDVAYVSGIDFAAIASKFAGNDFTKKDTVVRFIVAIKQLVGKIEEIMIKYGELTKLDGSPTEIGKEKLQTALTGFNKTLLSIAKEVNTVTEGAAYKDGYDTVVSKLTIGKDVIIDVLAMMKSALRDGKFGNYAPAMEQLFTTIMNIPAAIEFLIGKIKNVTKLTDFQRAK